MSASSIPVVIVLGAGMGGRAVANALTGTSHVVIIDRDQGFAQKAADSVVAAGGSGEAHAINLLDVPEVRALRDDLVARFGRIDAVVHLVGGWKGSKTVDEQAIDDWEALVPGIVGTVQTTSVVFRDDLMAAPHGRYVMVSSTGVPAPSAGNAAYASAKAAAETWVRALGNSFADTSARALIVAVMALVNAEMRAKSPEKKFTGFTDTEELAAAIVALLSDDQVENGARIPLTNGPT